jgi:hypothetical protein
MTACAAQKFLDAPISKCAYWYPFIAWKNTKKISCAQKILKGLAETSYETL